MDEVVVEIFHLALLEGLVVASYCHIVVVSVLIQEGGHLGTEVEALTRILLQGVSCGTFRLVHAVVRGCIIVVHSVLHGVVHHLVYFFLIDFSVWSHRQTHHTEAQQGDFGSSVTA